VTTEPEPRCGLACANPEHDGALCARRCETLYLADVADYPVLYAALGPDDMGEDYPDRHLLPGASSGGPKVTGSREAPLPARSAALNLRGPAANLPISRYAIETAAACAGRNPKTAAAHVADQHGHTPLIDALNTAIRELRPYLGSTHRLNQGTITQQIAAHVVWLDRQYDRYRTHPDILILAEVVRRAANTARADLGLFDAPIDRKPVPCRCNLFTLVQPPGSDDVECTNPDCRAVYYPDDYGRWAKRWAEWAATKPA
jgi:hypothetical protein